MQRVRHVGIAPALQPGELVTARVRNGIENRTAVGKARPVILVASKGSAWRVMGLTTRPRYRDGSPRVAVPNPAVVGLRGQGWLWGERLTWLSRLDILDHIGWVDRALAREVAALAQLDQAAVQRLLGTASEPGASR